MPVRAHRKVRSKRRSACSVVTCHTPGPSSNSVRRASTFCWELFSPRRIARGPTGTCLVTGGTAFHHRSQHTELPSQSPSSLAVDDCRVPIQFVDERLVNPIITSKIPCLVPGQLSNESPDWNQTHWYRVDVREKILSTVPSRHHDEVRSCIRNTECGISLRQRHAP